VAALSKVPEKKLLLIQLVNSIPIKNGEFDLVQTVTWSAWGANVTPAENQWYCFEFHIPPPAANATIDWWIDGAPQTGISWVNLSGIDSWYEIRCGLQSGFILENVVQNAYYDEVVASDTYIGPVQESVNGRLEFTSNTMTANQVDGQALITVRRRDGSTGAASVHYATSNGTAISGTDYTAASGTLNWSAAEISDKTFLISLANNTTPKKKRTINVTLDSPGGGAVLGSLKTMGATIVPAVLQKNSYYVSKNGNNQNGLSWSTAWNELDQINWTIIGPGDTIWLDGGALGQGMTYTKTLRVQQNGESGNPITLELSAESGHNGQAFIFGGRPRPLPYCGQVDYTYVVGGTGIDMAGSSWVTVEGRKWRGITIYACLAAIKLGRPFNHDLLFRNLEVYDCGDASFANGYWTPGISQEIVVDAGGVTNIAFERGILHDAGQDIFGPGGNTGSLTLRRCWLYDLRKNPVTGDAFDYSDIDHNDALQLYSGSGGNQGPLLVEDCIIGPGFMQGVFMQADPINDITIRNTLMFGNRGSGNIKVNSGVNRTLDHLTIDTISEGNNKSYEMYGTNFIVTNSIFTGGQVTAPGPGTISGNITWSTVWHQPWATDVDPKYLKAPVSWDDITADFTPTNATALGKGASITSIDKFFQLFPDANPGESLLTQTPTPVPTETPTPFAFTPVTGNEVRMFPNPAKNQVTFVFQLESKSQVKIEIFSVAGKKIAALNQVMEASNQAAVVWSCSRVSGGIYFVKISRTNGAGTVFNYPVRKIAVAK